MSRLVVHVMVLTPWLLAASAQAQAVRWHPGVGDPSLVGWVTTVLYLAGGALAWRAALRSRSPAAVSAGAAGIGTAPGLDRIGRLWLGIALCMAVLGLNKQLDLQTLLTEWARHLAHAQGWYEDRRRYQLAFLLGLFFSGCVVAAWLLRFFWDVLGRVRLALAGLCLIASYVFLRAALFQRVDVLRSSELAEAAWVLEVAGIALVSRSAWAVRPPRRA